MNKVIYTVAVDSKGEFLYRNLAKLLLSSIIRSGFDGTVICFHNSDRPLFPLGRSNLKEEYIDLNPAETSSISATLEARWSLKHQIAEVLLNEYEWDRILFIDADCVVTGCLATLFEGDWQLNIYREVDLVTANQFNCFLTENEMQNASDHGINSGIFCLDKSIASKFFQAWSNAELLEPQRSKRCLDQAAFNRVILDNNFVLNDFSNLVSTPYCKGHCQISAANTLITHWVGSIGAKKLRSSFGLYMQHYFYDDNLTLFNLIEN